MAKTKEKPAPVSGFADLVAHLESGSKPDRAAWRIGTEHEKFAFYKDTLEPVPYEGERGIGALLNGLADNYGWSRVSEGENLIALAQDGASITLEPGGQFELSGAPLEHLHQTCAETGSHLSQLRDVAGKLGISFLGLGVSPLWSLEATPIMPKGRYKIMRDYMAKVGRLGRQMMFRSCTVQTNLDFGSEADMVKKFRVGLALQPIATALFANSPFMEGRLNGFLSYRGHIWTDTDPDRTGMLPWVFEPGMGFERYAEYALDVPMYFVYRDGKYLDCSGQSFRAFMEGKMPVLPGELPTKKDWEDHLTTIFPEVRLKTYLEMRGADSGPWSRLCALPAFWAGIFYCDAALEAAWSLVKNWSAEDREALRRSVPALGLKAPIRGSSAREIAQASLAIARQGLKSRARTDRAGEDETHFLAELDDIAASGVTPAERLIERYNTEWKRDVRPVFEACAY
ncbi:MAG TPA: glutamate--cysteine ligase [Terricaulis sp.]|nr:glutamate--cysteine ligase [Terricaulis sp.]HRP10887.1 glutamate--cysteine ligase [Terricaulis sp.]